MEQDQSTDASDTTKNDISSPPVHSVANIYPTPTKGIGIDEATPTPKPMPLTTDEHHGPWRFLIGLGISLVVLGAVSGAGYFYASRNNVLIKLGDRVVFQHQASAEQAPATQISSQWLTYTASEIGMYVKYPRDWKLEPTYVQHKLSGVTFLPTKGGGASVAISWDSQPYTNTCTGGTRQISFASSSTNACSKTLANSLQQLQVIYNQSPYFGVSSIVSICTSPCTTSIAGDTSALDQQNAKTAMTILQGITFDKQLFDMSTWHTYNGDVYTVSYPSTWSFHQNQTSPTTAQIIDENSRVAWYILPTITQMSVTISTRPSTQMPQQLVDTIVSEPPYTHQNANEQTVITNGYKGVGYKPYDPNSSSYIWVFSNGNTLISVTMPLASDTQNVLIHQILSTFKVN